MTTVVVAVHACQGFTSFPLNIHLLGRSNCSWVLETPPKSNCIKLAHSLFQVSDLYFCIIYLLGMCRCVQC